jgi:hypothetical protein
MHFCCVCSGPVLALSGESQGGEFTSAFGGVAEVHGLRASAAFDANDPSETLGVHCGNGFSPYQSTCFIGYYPLS